jgi:hypothetical protein
VQLSSFLTIFAITPKSLRIAVAVSPSQQKSWANVTMIQYVHYLKKQISDNLANIFLFLAFAFLVVPVVSVKLPPILDYPNHYVRMWLLGGGVHIFPISEMYEVNWKNASTNIGIDALAAIFGKFLPVNVFAPIVLVAALVLPPLGVACLNRKLFGTSWWQVASVLLAWSWTLVLGFLNFEIGVGLALICAALDRALARPGILVASAGRSCIGAFLLLIHPFGFLFYIILVGALRLGRRFKMKPRMAVHRAIAAVTACLPITIPLVLLLLFAPVLPEAQLDPRYNVITWQKPGLIAHLSSLLSPFRTYEIRTDVVFLFLFFVPLALAVAMRRIRVHAGLFITAILLLVSANFMPEIIGDTSSIQLRFASMGVLALAASLLPGIPSEKRWQWAAMSIALLLVMMRIAWITNIWINRQADVVSLEKVLSHIPSGAAILPLEHRFSGDIEGIAPLGRFMGKDSPTFWHYPTLAILERHAFVPTLFTGTGKQPLIVKPPWNQIAAQAGWPPGVEQINDPKAVQSRPYLAHWCDRFDFLLVVNADMPNDGGAMPTLPQIQLVADEGYAQLYRILRRADCDPTNGK